MTTFVTEFKAYAKTRTDAPHEFHVHAAMATLAYAMGNRCYMDSHGGELFPNIWSVSIARSGMGKSIPLKLASLLIAKAGLQSGVLQSDFSQQSVYQTLAQPGYSQRAIWIEEEFSAFLGHVTSSYNDGFMQVLTQLFDVPEEWKRTTIKNDEVVLHRPAITILSSSSPDWFTESFKTSALRAGFFARFLFCPSDHVGEYVKYPGAHDQGIIEMLATHLSQVAKLSGKFIVDDAIERWAEFDQAQRQKVRKGEVDPDLAGMIARSGTMAWKAAMIMHVSANTYDLVMTDNDMRNAIRFVEYTHELASKYLMEEVPRDRYAEDRHKIVQVLKRLGGRALRSVVLKESHLSNYQFKNALETLLEADDLYTEPGAGHGFLVLPGYTPERGLNGTNGKVHHELGDMPELDAMPVLNLDPEDTI